MMHQRRAANRNPKEQVGKTPAMPRNFPQFTTTSPGPARVRDDDAVPPLPSSSLSLAASLRISVSLNSDEYAGVRSLAASSQRSLGWVMRYALRRLLADQTQHGQLELPFSYAIDPHPLRNPYVLQTAITRLTNADWARLRRRTSGTVHALHPYPTRFSPDLPARLIEVLSAPHQTVLDPFCGSGTTIIEALRLKRHAIGVDLSPLAVLISRAKCASVRKEDRIAIESTIAFARSLVSGFTSSVAFSDEEPTRLRSQLTDYCSRLGLHGSLQVLDPAALQEMASWFSPVAMSELFLIRAAIDQCPIATAKDLLLVSLSSVIVPLSFQSSDTRRVRIDRRVAPNETVDRWIGKLRQNLDLLGRQDQSPRWASAEIHQGDARNLGFLAPSIADLVVTSPPYPNTYDYRSFQRLRLLWIGQRSDPIVGDVGSPRHYGQRRDSTGDYEGEMATVLSSIKRVLKPTGLCALVVGPSRIRGRRRDNHGSICRAASDAGLSVIGSFSIGEASTTASLQNPTAPVRRGESVVVLQRHAE
jgi:SAM-dependent methyltransferase